MVDRALLKRTISQAYVDPPTGSEEEDKGPCVQHCSFTLPSIRNHYIHDYANVLCMPISRHKLLRTHVPFVSSTVTSVEDHEGLLHQPSTMVSDMGGAAKKRKGFMEISEITFGLHPVVAFSEKLEKSGGAGKRMEAYLDVDHNQKLKAHIFGVEFPFGFGAKFLTFRGTIKEGGHINFFKGLKGDLVDHLIKHKRVLFKGRYDSITDKSMLQKLLADRVKDLITQPPKKEQAAVVCPPPLPVTHHVCVGGV
jgi:hypothetical protein